ncbi:ABC transporter ATP-binding protein [Saccharibacillus sp. CPCC 101409]|uniref:ABC transporter ATP-binding protein n=1 Tax=Saccharibacillus sp. CPCC 101409 TaxID=3058041 RepID=UPI002672582A|nr:ABC transporter ATP-binding protein [Saccharibacillus sp. CPCC 101409]MDO3410397.1 ABC transporter ATP-binding protein [Saccharibacillus sp. CPCC 101409]
MTDLLNVENLRTVFETGEGTVQAVRGVSFSVRAGEVVGLVGESGSGKSVTARSLIRLIQPPGRIAAGKIEFDGEDLLGKTEKELRGIRGNRISMIFQDPMTSLNPVVRVGRQMTEVIRRHRKLGKEEARKTAIELLRQVGIPSPETRIDQYPHEFSGGMRQRVMIAMALSCKPQLLIADEPTTALDVTVQAQILHLIRELKDSTRTAVLMITHDLGVVAQICSRVVVMYGGLIMEEGPVERIFAAPRHPYTQGLLRSIPRPGTEEGKQRLTAIEGTPPNLADPPPGCPFRERCPHAMEVCAQMPHYTETELGHRALCWLLDNSRQTEASAVPEKGARV